VPGSDENNLIHAEEFRVYKLLIWMVKTEIDIFASACGQQKYLT
jgi:hypothetical protein